MLGELYHPKGKALETAQAVLQVEHPMAVNIAYGCTNTCEYCYIPYIEKGSIRFPKQPANKLVEKQLNNGLKPEGVFLCFATDPFLSVNNLSGVSLKILQLLKQRKIKSATLSKNFGSVFSDIVGFTIVSFEEKYYKRYEPRAYEPQFRLELAQDLKNIGTEVFISVEPYPIPSVVEQELPVFLYHFVDVADFLIFGKRNYDANSSTPEARIFYAKCVDEFQEFCKNYGIRHWVKSETLKFVKGT